LTGLCFLNLSQIHLMGKIPKIAGNMILLEFFDLSIENLFGEVSWGISTLPILKAMELHLPKIAQKQWEKMRMTLPGYVMYRYEN
ncbi:hypothetical protein SO802_024195, partial [Lithocarpus litseifolius]